MSKPLLVRANCPLESTRKSFTCTNTWQDHNDSYTVPSLQPGTYTFSWTISAADLPVFIGHTPVRPLYTPLLCFVVSAAPLYIKVYLNDVQIGTDYNNADGGSGTYITSTFDVSRGLNTNEFKVGDVIGVKLWNGSGSPSTLNHWHSCCILRNTDVGSKNKLTKNCNFTTGFIASGTLGNPSQYADSYRLNEIFGNLFGNYINGVSTPISGTNCSCNLNGSRLGSFILGQYGDSYFGQQGSSTYYPYNYKIPAINSMSWNEVLV